nr:peptidylprolyl isomerase [Vagococcus acidifermentans]
MIRAVACSALLLLLGGCGTNSQTDKTKTTASSEEQVDLNSLELPQLNNEVADNEYLVEMETTKGNIKLKLFPEQAPKAVENFVTHAKDGYYNDVIFHRVIQDFMIQSGDPEGTGMGGESIWGTEFAPEISKQLYHLNGALAMARTQGDITDKTQGSQFYIVSNETDQSDGLLFEDYPEKIIEAYKNGGVPALDPNYSVFGQTIEGMDVVKAIAAVETENEKPKEDIVIKKITILQEPK